jgi:hypothetical protein
MTTTLTQARDEILTVFRDAWLASSESNALPVLYPDTDDELPDSGAWARVSVRHGTGGQATLANHDGQRRYRHTGFVTVELYTPRGDGLVLNDQLSTIVKHAFEGVTTCPGQVIFRRVRVNEVGPDGQWFHTNVLVDFEYDEVR